MISNYVTEGVFFVMKIFYVDRKTQIKHFSDLSAVQDLQPLSELSLRVPASENFALQLVLLPEGEGMVEHVVQKGDLDMVCINTQVTDKFGAHREQKIKLRENRLQPVFFIIRANSKKEGEKAQSVISFETDKENASLRLCVEFTGEYVQNGGFNDIWRLSRLIWLNSDRFLDNSPVEPYFEPRVESDKICVLGRDISIAQSGLPENVTYYFDEGINLTQKPQKKLLKHALSFDAGSENIVYSDLKIEQDGGSVHIFSAGESENLSVCVKGIVHYEGSAEYSVILKAKNDVVCEDISLCAEICPECSEFVNGLGSKGGYAHDIRFKWNDEKHWDTLYTGAVNAGVRFKWKAEDYVRPLINVYYKNLPMKLPRTTWDNCGRGGIVFEKDADSAKVRAYTGKYSLKKGEERHFDFELHFTPLKPIDYKKHYSVRYSHYNELKNEYKQVDEAERLGLNYVNIHHGNEVHPFINYPFIETQRLKHLVQYAAYKNIGVKVYYTVREHSNHMAEVFAYKALGDEIIMRKNGDGHSWWKGTPQWLTEYFGDTILPAWRVEYKHGKYKGDADISFIVHPDSRIDNYYIEGLDWLVKNIGIKGIYIDDTALDRTTLERAKKVLSQNGGLIDMHMWNHEAQRAGDISSMNLYTEIFPFLDSLWIGEGYPYKKLSPEYLLTEVSGIPYGQTSQLLEGGGDPFIGMLFAMNNRYGWGVKNAQHIYKLWDDFQIQNSEMRGWWHSKNPVSTGNDDVKATVYINKGKALLCMFNFGKKPVRIVPEIDAGLLGFSPVSAVKPHIKTVQLGGRVNLKKGIFMMPKDGAIITLNS